MPDHWNCQLKIETTTGLRCGEGVSELTQSDQYLQGMNSFDPLQLILV